MKILECPQFDVYFPVPIRHIPSITLHFPEHVQVWHIDANGNYVLVKTEQRKNVIPTQV